MTDLNELLTLTQDQLAVVAELCPRCAKLVFACGGPAGANDLVGRSRWFVRATPIWDDDLEVYATEPTLLAALTEALVQLRSLEAAEQAAADIN